MDQSYLNFLDQSTAKQNEAKSYLDSLPTQRNAGVDKLKIDQGYADKRNAVDSATKTLYETQRRLDALPKQAQQRTAGRNVTQSQLDRIVGAESQPLSQQYKDAGLGREQASQGLSLVDQALKDYTNQFNQDAQLKYQGTIAQAGDLFNRYQAGSGEYWKTQEAEMQRQAQANARAQAAADRANQMAMAKQQASLQERLARLGMGGNNAGANAGATNPNLRIEIPNDPTAQQTASSVQQAGQGIFDFWNKTINKGAEKQRAGGNPFGFDGVRSVYDDTLGRIFNNR